MSASTSSVRVLLTIVSGDFVCSGASGRSTEIDGNGTGDGVRDKTEPGAEYGDPSTKHRKIS